MLKFPNENPGRVLDFYTLGRELGSGAFSRVVEATDKAQGGKHAIKIVNKEETNAREMYSELSIMSQLNHVNIVNFRELFDELDGYYVVMEVITGGELFDRIIELRRYSEKDAAHVMKQACLGLLHMHEKGLAHRDIKPENLLLSSKEADATVKVADFGFAKQLKKDTDLYETLGTPPYMAPEIVLLRNEDEDYPGYGRPVDVWALGICLYILLSGIHPFQIDDEEKMLCNIESGKWPWKGSNWEFVSEDAKALITSMMEPDVKKRFTIQQCLDSKWIASNNRDEALGGVQESIKTFQAKKKLKGAIGAVVATQKLSLLLGGGGLAAQAAQPGAGAPPRPAPREEKSHKFSAVTVQILSGQDLISKDSNGKSDPYVTVWCGANKPYKTKIKKKTLNPEWKDEKVTFSSQVATGKKIEFEVYDHDIIPPDEFMGRLEIAVDSLEVGKVYKQQYPLQAVTDNKKKAGKVKGFLTLEIQKHP